MTAVVEQAGTSLHVAIAHLAGHLVDDSRIVGRAGTRVETNERTGERWYYDPTDMTRRYASITYVISASESSPWLTGWASRLAAEQAVEHCGDTVDILAALGPAAAVEMLRHEADIQLSLAADVGTWHHDVLEALVLDRPIPDPPQHILGRTLTTGGERLLINQETLDLWADGILTFLHDFRVVPIMSESTVANPREGYAGRIDLGAELPGHGLALIDCKSGGYLRTSVYAQLAAQMHATEVWLPDGRRADMPRFDWGGVLHLRPRFACGYKLHLAPTGEKQWGWFRAAARLLMLREQQPELTRTVIYPPVFGSDGQVLSIPTAPMIEDTGLRYWRKLAEAGFTWIHELAGFTCSDLLSNPKTGTGIKGIGPKSIEAIRCLLAEHGLALAGESVTARDVA